MKYEIINFYEFKPLGSADELTALKIRLREALVEHSVFGTIIIAGEGYNASLCSEEGKIQNFISAFEQLVDSRVDPKVSFADESPFRKHEVKIKPEIVTLKQRVDLELGAGTHVDPREWNALISDPSVFVLDTRNDYEYLSGTFKGAVNPRTEKFSDLPEFVAKELDPRKHTKIAMFCTGGIRCEKFAPFMKEAGFEEVYQLKGGILKYLEIVPAEEQLWDGECFVFDERTTLNEKLEKGAGPDYSLRHTRPENR